MRRSGRKRTQRVLFTESPDSDGDDNFHKKRDNAAGKRKKKGIVAPPAPIFKKQSKKKKDEADGKKRKNSSNGNDGSGSGAAAAPIFSGKGKGCRKGGTAAGMLMGLPSDALLTEQRSIEFAARRRLEADMDRERRRKREEALGRGREASSLVCHDMGEQAAAASVFGQRRKNRRLGEREISANDSDDNGVVVVDQCGVDEPVSPLTAPRFPFPSHVLGGSPPLSSSSGGGWCCGAEEGECRITGIVSGRALSALRASSRHPGGGEGEEGDGNLVAKSAADDDRMPGLLCGGYGDDQIEEEYALPLLLSSALSSALVLPPPLLGMNVKKKEKKIETMRTKINANNYDHRPWPDTYGIHSVPSDVVGVENRDVASHLLEFIGRWREHRADLLKRSAAMAAKKRGKAEKTPFGISMKPSKKETSYGYKDDDFIWSDSDEEDAGLCSVFLLTGPTGCGKTNLVRAAAESQSCVVLEINTSEERGGAALRRAIQECTQCHSSVAVLKKRGIDDDDSVDARGGYQGRR